MANYANDIPILPEGVIRQVEEVHEGRLWAWTIQKADSGWRLAIAIANLPGLRNINGIEFTHEEDAEMAAQIHNNCRGLSATEARRIIRSEAVSSARRAAEQVD